MSDGRGEADSTSALHLQDTVRLSAEGFAKILGDLEARVLRAVWETGRPAPAREIHERVLAEHDCAIHTTITVLNKLVRKGLLHRESRGDLLHFEARISEDELRALASRRLIEGILALGPEEVTASFVDVLAEQDPERLNELARLVARRLAEQDE